MKTWELTCGCGSYAKTQSESGAKFWVSCHNGLMCVPKMVEVVN